MKLSIEATDKLENKDFPLWADSPKTHIAMVCGTVLASLSLIALVEEKIKAWSMVTRKVTELLQVFNFLRLVYIQEYLPLAI